MQSDKKPKADLRSESYTRLLALALICYENENEKGKLNYGQCKQDLLDALNRAGSKLIPEGDIEIGFMLGCMATIANLKCLNEMIAMGDLFYGREMELK